MRTVLAFGLLLILAGCGGYGGGSGTYTPPMSPANPANPTTAPANPQQSSVLPTAMLKGSPGFTTPSGFTVYTFDADTQANVSACATISGCTGLWPPVSPPAGAALISPWASFMRPDGKTQLSYKGKPLYTYAGDSAPGQTNGDNLFQFGALWHIARP